MLDLNGVSLGRYQIVDRVSRGGMSAVFEAAIQGQGGVVAVKVLPPAMSLDGGFRARFEREIRVLRELAHPHIVPILDYGDTPTASYIVMPFYRGGTLEKLLEGGKLPLGQTARIIHQIASALDHAHQHGVVHRDVKPSNVLVDDRGEFLLSDFGVAHLPDTSINLTGSSIIGTPAYMSPEQCSGEDVDGRSDQYSLAVVIYQMVTGDLPFDSQSPMSVVIKQIHHPVPLPVEKNPELPESVQDVLLKALAKDPEKRFASVGEMNRSLQAAIQEALDPRYRTHWLRKLQRRARGWLRKIGVGIDVSVETERQRTFIRRLTAIMVILGLALTAVVAFAMNVRDGLPETILATPADLALTIEALSTGLQTQDGANLSPGEFQVAVKATLTALAPPQDASNIGLPITGAEPSPTPNPGASPSATRRATPGGALSPATLTAAPPPSPTPTQTALPLPTATGTLNPSPTPTRTSTATRTPSPTPTATRTPLPTPTSPSPTPTRLPPVHVESTMLKAKRRTAPTWEAIMTIAIRDGLGEPVLGVAVTGTWTAINTPFSAGCITIASGRCSISSGMISSSMATFTITSVYHSQREYRPADNVDPLTRSVSSPY